MSTGASGTGTRQTRAVQLQLRGSMRRKPPPPWLPVVSGRAANAHPWVVWLLTVGLATMPVCLPLSGSVLTVWSLGSRALPQRSVSCKG
eukprot:289603-Amphidinium_carterae.2